MKAAMEQSDKKIVGVMDLGSQTFRLAAAICGPKDTRIEGSWLENVRLGEGLSSEGLITQAAMRRGTDALEKFRQILDTLSGDEKCPVSITAVGTAALRNAHNSTAFMDRASALGIDIEIISGNREAELTAQGVSYTLEDVWSRRGRPPAAGKVAIIDAGGGSTEISLCDSRGELTAWTSLEIGAVRLTEEYFKARTSPPEPSALEEMKERIDSELKANSALLDQAARASLLAGSGGTATTMASMEAGMETYDPSRIRGMELTEETIHAWINRLSRMTKNEKDSICGLEPERSDIILSGILIIHRALTKMGFPALTVSDGGLLLGLLISAIKKECTSHAEPSRPRGLYV